MVTSNPEGKAEVLHRVTRDEMYGIVGEPTEVLKALVPTFSEKLIADVIEGFNQGGREASLVLIGEGKGAQRLIVKITRPAEGTVLRVVMKGNWASKPDVPLGLPIFSEFNGKFYRSGKPDTPPVAEIGAILEPRGAYGLAFRGKSDLWYLRLSPGDFPNGGRITAFVQSNGAEVEARKSILLYVDPL